MGFLSGGSSQSTSSIVSSIDFSPIIQFGEDQSSTQDKINEQTATVSPELDDSLGLSASVGVLGGTGGQATTSRMQDEQPTQTAPSSSLAGAKIDSQSLLYIGGGVVALGGIYYLTKNKKKK